MRSLFLIRRNVNVKSDIRIKILCPIPIDELPAEYPSRIVTAMIVMTSKMSSTIPIDSIVCPNFVFVNLNSFNIGSRMASPMVAKDRESKNDIIQDRSKM